MNRWTRRAKNPFYFCTRLNLRELTGLRAYDLRGLVEHIKTVPGSVIYNHTHIFLQQHQYLSPEPPNDFAYWVTQALGEDELGELLGSIDISEFISIRALREKIIEVIEKFLFENKRTLKTAPRGKEFNFMKGHSFILPTPFVARNLGQFIKVLDRITVDSIYFHIFEARMRLERGINDFSYWIEDSLDMPELAQRISRLDPYTYTLHGLRGKIIDVVKEWCHHR